MTSPQRKRFSVSLEPKDFKALKKLAESRKPKVTLQYLVEHAIQDLLERVENGMELRAELTGAGQPSDSARVAR